MWLVLMESCAQRDGSWRPGILRLEVLKQEEYFLFNSILSLSTASGPSKAQSWKLQSESCQAVGAEDTRSLLCLVPDLYVTGGLALVSVDLRDPLKMQWLSSLEPGTPLAVIQRSRVKQR